MTMKNLEGLIGILVLSGIAAVALPTLESAREMVRERAKPIQLLAHFDDIGGLGKNASVRCAGVSIGRVMSVSLDRLTHRGVVEMAIDDGVRIPVESFASIRSAGMMGNDFIEIEPGEGHATLADGDVVARTHSAMNLEDVIQRYLATDKAHVAAPPSGRSVVAVAHPPLEGAN